MTEQQNKTVDFPGEIKELPGGGIVLSKLDDVINWARSNSLWPLTFATSCCGIEMMAVASAKYDFSRFGFEVARASPRQAGAAAGGTHPHGRELSRRAPRPARSQHGVDPAGQGADRARGCARARDPRSRGPHVDPPSP